METIQSLLESRIRVAIAGIAELEPQVTPTADSRFGDYQTNVAMILAKQQRANPRQLAQQIIEKLDVDGLCEAPQIAGAGFINFRLLPDFLANQLALLIRDERLGVPLPSRIKKIVVDFSSPNVAKPMHVGHIRSTILGDSLARIATFIGHDVVRDNHIGDWGTQFGMLLVGWKSELNQEALEADPLSEMERIYKLISVRCKEDPATLDRVRQELVKLQGGDEENLALWKQMIRLSQAQFDTVYSRLGVRFDATLGESFYNPRLGPVVSELRERGIAVESQGALCVLSDHRLPEKEDPFLIQRDGQWTDIPAIVQKADGAANYTTTDLATLQYRFETWKPDEILYVTDGRQQLHFRQFFTIFERWQPELAAKTRLAHVWFGSILGDDNKPFKTRSGETIRLVDLLDEAEERALKIIAEKNPLMPEIEQREIATIVGLGSVKYADLLPSRQSDYVFSWDKMLSLQGNTAPYLMYSYVRIQAIFRKAALEPAGEESLVISLSEPAEIALVKKLLLFGEVLPQVLVDFRPNVLANYLFELASTFHGFFEACPVLKAEPAVRAMRLALCKVTAKVLARGLDLLGIAVPERM
ncbi:MAG: arginyl-tRNA synthetase [Chthoniobacteraceae bacterium]|nr:arginyl-tRNA synthetase [Chthoniobacteraceae bacterium]